MPKKKKALKALQVLYLKLPGQCATKKTQQQIALNKETNLPFIVQNRRFLDWQHDMVKVVEDWKRDMQARYGISFPLAEVRMTMHIYFANVRRRDGPGCLQALCDMLQVAGVIPDDNWTNYAGGSWDPFLDRNNPRVEIWIHVLNFKRSSWEERKIENIRSKKRAQALLSKPIPIE